MRPVTWSSSYLFRWPFGISIVTSNCTPRSVAHRGPALPGGVTQGGGHHRVDRFDRHVRTAVAALVTPVPGVPADPRARRHHGPHRPAVASHRDRDRRAPA